jgi:hypothetical protein
MMHYLDEARSIDARRVMAGALKSGRREGYDSPLDWPDPVCREPGAFLHPTLSIDLQWPAAATDPVHGTVLIRYPGADGKVVEQSIKLKGTPARVGGWQWQFTCPDTNRQVRTLYLAPEGKRFQSREAAELKSRRLSRLERHQRSYYRLVRRLQTTQWTPLIPKPAGMAEETYDRLCDQLERAHIRLLCAALGRPEPEFWDTKPARHTSSSGKFQPEPHLMSLCKRLSKSLSRSATRNLGRGRYIRDDEGALQLRPNLKKPVVASAVQLKPPKVQ